MLAIFDMSSVNILRYNDSLLSNIKEQYIAYVDDPECCTEIDNPDVTLICSSGWSIKKIINSFKRNKVSAVLISSQRPADLRIILASNQLKIHVIYKMHGLYTVNITRKYSFYFSNFRKVVRTVGYLFDIAMYTKNITIISGVILSFVFGASREKWMTSEMLRVEHGLIWSEYWEKWHEEHWSMNPRQGWKITGNPDTTKFSNTQVDTNSICYVYQTLVEDGKIACSVMESFYDMLADVAKNQNKKVNVKWHARGSSIIRRALEARGFHIHNSFPVGKTYVGHYSSLLGLVPLIDGFLIVFELEGHLSPLPISKCATFVANDKDSLVTGLTSSFSIDNSKKENAIYYFGTDYDYNVEASIISKYT